MQNHCVDKFHSTRFSPFRTSLGLGVQNRRLWDLEILVFETSVAFDLLEWAISGMLILLKCCFLDFEIFIFVENRFSLFFLLRIVVHGHINLFHPTVSVSYVLLKFKPFWIFSVCAPQYVMCPPVTEHVPLHSKSLCKNIARASGGCK